MSQNTAKAVVTLRDLTAKFDNKLKSATPFYPRICTVNPSNGSDEKYAMLGNMPGMREWLGDRQFHDLRASTYEIANKHFESSLLIKKTDQDDDRLGMYGMPMEQLAIEAAYHPDELLFALVNNAEATAGWDGQYFFDTDHLWGDSGSQSNDLTYNADDPNAVTAAEFRAAYHAARAKLLSYKNDQGKLLNRPVIGRMDGLMLMVSPVLELVAHEALDSVILGDSTNIVLDKPTIVVAPQYGSDVKFDLYKTNEVLKPYIFQAREPLRRQMKGADDIETKDLKFMTEARYNVGYGAWWTAVRTTFN